MVKIWKETTQNFKCRKWKRARVFCVNFPRFHTITSLQAREAVEMRAQVERKIASKEKEAKERQLRALAEEARNKRAGIKRDDKGTQVCDDVTRISGSLVFDHDVVVVCFSISTCVSVQLMSL